MHSKAKNTASLLPKANPFSLIYLGAGYTEWIFRTVLRPFSLEPENWNHMSGLLPIYFS